MWTREGFPKKLKTRRQRLGFSRRSGSVQEEKAVGRPTAMASTQTGLKAPFKDLTSFKGSVKRLWREKLEDAPIKKRLMAEMKLKRRGPDALPRTPKVKRENVDEQPCEMEDGGGRRDGTKALDLSPGLKRTLAQFTLSSQSSLGGPAAFSARGGHETPGALLPLPSPPVLGGGPLLVPCDSSTELTHSVLEGESISCFMVGGEKRLCLPQVLNSVLREFSLQQINGVCDELYVYCSRCDSEQLSILKVLGILPFNAPSCGLITLTDAQRLCNALLHPGVAALPRDPSGKLPAPGLPLKEGGEAGFRVEHQCLGKCQGLFVPRFYVRPDAPCIQCLECQLLFSPDKFVMHSHRSPDKRTCHWGFDSAKWPCYLQLGRKHLGTPEEEELKRLLDDMKEKFGYQLKRTPEKKAGADEGQVRKAVPDFCPLNGKLSDGESGRKAKSQPTLDFNRLYPDIKQEPAHTAIVHPSYFLYTYDKMVAPNVSLPSSLRKEDEAGPEALGALLKRHCSEARRRALSHEQDREQDRDRAADGESRAHSQEEPGARREARPVAMETGADEDAHAAAKDAGWEDDKDRMVLEIVQMYSRQQERLHSTLHKQMQLEMELEALRGGEAVRLRELSAERSELQSELEAVHTEHAQRLGEVRQEQRELERRLEQLRQQGCACEASSQREQEARYTAQLSELRRRLDRAEADREELQEELCREREAREKLELMISQLKEQMSQSTSAAEKPSPSPSPAPKTPAPAEGSPAQE
ncbi:ski-like protein [Conger conger]|uniref:ski-like protein n=1 Tax=Conger conger TaxID=82655 RepID=UPI002A5AF460|nr:ski-like protein [Conger conger]